MIDQATQSEPERDEETGLPLVVKTCPGCGKPLFKYVDGASNIIWLGLMRLDLKGGRLRIEHTAQCRGYVDWRPPGKSDGQR